MEAVISSTQSSSYLVTKGNHNWLVQLDSNGDTLSVTRFEASPGKRVASTIGRDSAEQWTTITTVDMGRQNIEHVKITEATGAALIKEFARDALGGVSSLHMRQVADLWRNARDRMAIHEARYGDNLVRRTFLSYEAAGRQMLFQPRSSSSTHPRLRFRTTFHQFADNRCVIEHLEGIVDAVELQTPDSQIRIDSDGIAEERKSTPSGQAVRRLDLTQARNAITHISLITTGGEVSMDPMLRQFWDATAPKIETMNKTLARYGFPHPWSSSEYPSALELQARAEATGLKPILNAPSAGDSGGRGL